MAFGEDKIWEHEPRASVTEEQVRARLDEWVELAKAHEGELAVTYSATAHHWPLWMGVIRKDLNTGEPTITLTEAPTVAFDGKGEIIESKAPMGLSRGMAHNSFQLFDPRHGMLWTAPQTQVVFGNEAVATWFSNTDHYWAVPYRYVQMARKLGLQPIITPEVARSLADRKLKLTARLVQIALQQSSLTARIQGIYDSIGGGSRSLHGGLATGMAPGDKIDAAFMALGHKEERDRNGHAIERLQKELAALGVQASDYYSSVAWLLGLDLPEQQTEPTAQ